MSTNTDFDTDPVESQLRELVAEIVAQAPSVDELTAVRLSEPGRARSSSDPVAAPFARWSTIAAAVSLLIAAVVGGLWLARPSTSSVATQVPMGEQPYRWEATFPGLVEQFSIEGAVDPSKDWFRARWHSDGERLEFIYDGEIVGTRYEGHGDLVGLDEEQAAEIAGNWYSVEDGDPLEEFAPLLLDGVTALGMFEIEAWEDLGSDDIDGVSTQHLRATNAPSPDAQEDLSNLVSLVAVGWDGPLDVWARDDGRIARIVLYEEQQGELVASAKVEFLDFGIPIDTTWPDGTAPSEQLPSSILSTRTESGRGEATDSATTLDESSDVAQIPDGSMSETLGGPVSTDGDADVFDLTLVDGARFRLSLPAGIGSDLVVVQTANSNGLVLESTRLRLDIAYEFCPEPDRLVINPLGMEVPIESSDLLWVCRSDELLSMSIEHSPPLTRDELTLVDLRPILPAGEYGAALGEFWPELRDCSNCSPWGPMIFPEHNVVVNRTGQTSFTGVELDTLAKVWSVDTGGFGSQMHAGVDSIFLSDPAGSFLKISADSGQQLWSIDITEEHAATLSSHAPDRLLLNTSFSSEGDSRPPVLRSIDDQTGDIAWSANGRQSAEWQFTRPVVFDGLAILMDVYDNPAIPDSEPGGMLHAFDIETGETIWTTDLESSPALFSHRLVFVADFETGPALIARTVDGDVLRVDPANGTISWRAQISAFDIDGTDFDKEGALAISVVTAAGQVLLNPTTGETVES